MQIRHAPRVRIRFFASRRCQHATSCLEPCPGGQQLMHRAKGVRKPASWQCPCMQPCQELELEVWAAQIQWTPLPEDGPVCSSTTCMACLGVLTASNPHLCMCPGGQVLHIMYGMCVCLHSLFLQVPHKSVAALGADQIGLHRGTAVSRGSLQANASSADGQGWLLRLMRWRLVCSGELPGTASSQDGAHDCELGAKKARGAFGHSKGTSTTQHHSQPAQPSITSSLQTWVGRDGVGHGRGRADVQAHQKVCVYNVLTQGGDL